MNYHSSQRDSNMAKIRNIFQDYLILIRVIYVGYAVLWFFLNKNNIIISQWDAQRIGVPIVLYTTIPSVSLLLYAIFPSIAIWIIPVATLILGWSLHVQKIIVFFSAHMNVKTDRIHSIISILFNVFCLAVCIIVLYFSGPYIEKRLRRGNNTPVR